MSSHVRKRDRLGISFGSRRSDEALGAPPEAEVASPTGEVMVLNNQDEEDQRHNWILREMYVPPSARDKPVAEQDLVDLVFAHGLGGNLKGTWKQEGTTEPWFTKKEFLGPLQDSVRVLSFGYNANRFDNVANTRIINHANDLLRDLVRNRLDCPDRPIIFIAHSLGGLIVKRAILLSSTRNEWLPIKESAKSIIFMGTPHMGSDQAENLVVVQRLASIMKFEAPIATNLTKELKTFSTSVQDINQEFTVDVHKSMDLLCFYESQPQRLPNGSKEIIVPPWSAVLQGIANIDCGCTHSALSKFRHPSDPRFERFWGEVQRLVRKAKPPLKLIHPSSWVDEEIPQQPVPNRAQQKLAPPRRRSEIVSKSPKPSRASIIRSSANANEILAGIIIHKPPEPEKATPQPREQPEEVIDLKELMNFLRLLRPVTSENQGMDREQPHRNTCKWVGSDPMFSDWLNRETGGMLFITGFPGCGKSHLAKYIQGMLETPNDDDTEQSQPLVVSFYCDSLESSRANPPILDSVIRALLGKEKVLFRGVQKKIPTVRDSESNLRFNHLMEVLNILVTDAKCPPTCIVIDGLDQCADEFVLKFLRGLDNIFRRDSSPSKLKIVITSRLTDSIRGFAFRNLHLDMSPARVGEDIQQVVDEEVEWILKSRQIASIGRDSVSAVIVERANGSFLFASSVLKELWDIKDTGANAVFTLLTSCPSTMEAIYQQDMNRLEAERPDLFKLIQFICIARRALRIPEARSILQLDNPDVTATYDVVGDLTRRCPRLVKFGAEGTVVGTVELHHQTLYDFIMNTYEADAIHGALAETCLKYLRGLDWDEALEDQQTSHSVDESDDVPAMPFLEYAAAYVGNHFSDAHEMGTKSAWDIWEFLCSDEGEKWQRYVTPKPRRRATSLSSSLSYETRSSISLDTDNDSAAWSDVEDAASDAGQPGEDDGDNSDDSESDASSVSSSVGSYESGTLIFIKKPPLVVLAQWDVEAVVKELFFEALESSPRQILYMMLGMVPFIRSRSPAKSQKQFRAMVNDIWEETTAVHYAAAQSGRVLELLLPFMDDINQRDDHGATILMLAAGSGESRGVKALLAAGAEVNLVDKWGQTALYSALHTTNSEAIRMLLEAGADPDIPADSGHSPLEVAIGQNNAEHTELLLKFGPDVTLPMTTGQPATFLANRLDAYAVLEELLPYVDVNEQWDGERLIHNVTWRGLESVVRKLIALGANLDDPPEGTPKATPVALAAENEHNEILEALLEAGADKECPVYGLSSALHIAASRGYYEACRLLIEYGADIDAVSEKDQTPLYIAADKQWEEVVALLVSYGADPRLPSYEPPLLVAADIGSLEMVKSILSGRSAPNVDARSSKEHTALGLAATSGDADMVSVLLDHGAAPNRRSGTRMSNMPLQLAVNGKHEDASIELLKRGATPLPKRMAEQSPFHIACFEGLMNVIQAFFEVKEPSELVNMEWGWFGVPILQAATGGHAEVVRILLDHGASPNYALAAKSYHGKTVLHGAAEGGSIEVMDMILEVVEDANLNVRDAKGRTPLTYACVRGRLDMVKHLLEKGARPDSLTEAGENAVFSAVEGGSLEVLEAMLEANPDLGIDLPRDDGKTPLILASSQVKPDILEALLKRGAAVNRSCHNGNFPLAEAIKYRRRAIVDVLLGRDDIDLLQLDSYGRNALGMAQAAGTHQMPGMVLAAAKTAEIESQLMQQQDIFGLSAYNYTRIDRSKKVDWDIVVKGIRGTAQDLLDDFKPRGYRWERLGKFLLQAHSETFAQIALWRSVELVETTPIYLEHMIPCRLCLDSNISSQRWTCMTCCNTDLCHHCMARYDSLGNRMWTCQHHEYYRVGFPRRVDPEKASSKRTSRRSSVSSEGSWVSSELSDEDSRRGLSPIQEIEEASDRDDSDREDYDQDAADNEESDHEGLGEEGTLDDEDIPEEETEASAFDGPSAPEDTTIQVDGEKEEGSENGEDGGKYSGEENGSIIGGPSAPGQDIAGSEIEGDEVTSLRGEPADSEGDTMALVPGEAAKDSDSDSDSGDEDDDYTDRSEEDLRSFLTSVLDTFPEDAVLARCRRYKFSHKRWRTKLRDPDELEALEDEEPPVAVEVTYKYLSCVPYIMTKGNLVLSLTNQPYNAYHERARKRWAGEPDGPVEEVKRSRRDEHRHGRRTLVKRESAASGNST